MDKGFNIFSIDDRHIVYLYSEADKDLKVDSHM